jgi:hypothetical protein
MDNLYLIVIRGDGIENVAVISAENKEEAKKKSHNKYGTIDLSVLALENLYDGWSYFN